MTTNASAETVRDGLATLLEAARVAGDLSCKAVYNYQKGDLSQYSPVVVATSAGTARPKLSLQGRRTTVHLNVIVLVLYSDEGDWTEAKAEDRVDLLEAEIVDVIDTNTCNAGVWRHLDLNGRSEADFIIFGGLEYKRLVIPMIAEV